MKVTHLETLGPTARAIVRVIEENPGIHFRELARATDITSMGQLRHHVDRLAEQGVLFEVEDERYKRFFLVGEQTPQMRKAMTRFSRPVPRRIGTLLLRRPHTRTELRRCLGCADSTLGYHLSRLTYTGDIVRTGHGTRRRYALADPRTVHDVLSSRSGPRSNGSVVDHPPGEPQDRDDSFHGGR